MDDSIDRPVRRRWFLLWLIALVPVLLLLYVGVREARIAARRHERALNMKQLGFALLNFDTVYKRLPLAVHCDEEGRPLSSWRFFILPFVEAIMCDWDYAVRWDDPVNTWLTGEPYWVYCFRANESGPERVNTNVVAVTGPGTAFDGERACRLAEIDSDTILAIEVAESGTPWAAPGDITIDQISPAILEGFDGGGAHVLFADGLVWFIPADTPVEDFKKLMTIEGAKKYDRDELFKR